MTATALLSGSACSLMAPSDAELMGKAKQSSLPNAGAPVSAAGEGGGATDGSNASGGDGEGAGLPEGGAEETAAGAGGAAAAGESASLIPQDGLALWLMADQGVVLGEHGGIAVWSDFSVNEADARQSLLDSQPTLVPGEGRVLPLVELDGAGDHLVLPSGFADFSAGVSAFIVASASTDQECPSLLQFSNESEQQDIEIGRYLGTVHYEVDKDEVIGDVAFGLEQLLMVGLVHAPEKSPELRLNGVVAGAGDFTALPVVKPRINNYVGRSLYPGCKTFHGRIGEIILYSRALSPEDRGAVELYLQGKWSYVPPVKTKPGPGEIPAAQ